MRSDAAPVCLVVSLLLAAPLCAQGLSLDIGRLTLGVDSMSISMLRSGTEVPVGSLWDELLIVPGPGDVAYAQRVYRTENRVFGPHLDTVVAVLPTLRLVYRRTIARIMTDSIGVAHDSLIGWTENADGVRKGIRRPLPIGVIDAGSFDLLVRGHDWTPGASFSVRAFLPGQDSLATLHAAFGAAERVRQRDGQDALSWRIDADFSGMAVTMWVDQHSRALVKEIIQVTPDIAMVMVR